MTRAVRDRILKDANGDIGDHLRNHIHLTNCIHLKNHMHKHSPILTDRSLIRDLIVLQRSRSLRDPSASPPSWHSPSIVDQHPKKAENDGLAREGRRSIGIERQRDSKRLSGNSPPFVSLLTSKVAPGEIAGVNDLMAAISERSSKSGVRDVRRTRREESSRKSNRIGIVGGEEEPPVDQDSKVISNDVSGNSASKTRKVRQKGKHIQVSHAKTLSEQLNDMKMDSDGVASSNIHLRGGQTHEKAVLEAEESIRGYCSGLNRVKRRKFRGARRRRAAAVSKDINAQNELSVASNTVAQGSVHSKYNVEGEEEFDEQNVTKAPRNGCGIPWNWSRIHHRGKTILDMAGKSLSCGLSDSRLRKGGPSGQGRDISNIPVASEYSSSSSKSDGEALPLLVDASGSQLSTENADWVRRYSGELGIYAENLFKHDVDSDLASEARSGDQRKLGGRCRSRHQNLTEKYMPKTFRELVGQNLVAQALSNAVMRRKVGLLYVFYGPHGTGKTSCARVFARALNCLSLEHHKPCGFCNSCIAHDMGKNKNIREVGPVSNFDFERIMDLLDNMVISQLPSHYRVFIFDDCDTLSPECWSAISKVIDRAPRRVVFVLVCSSLDLLPHIIISRCQKFFFPKLKDADIIYTLQWISHKEDLEIDKDALKLIASRSDGSLRDAEMTLEQLSLLGQKISVPLVQELVGLICDEKLVDLLDLALSADTVNTVKSLRVIMETGVEPLGLMSQLATIITDILAGSYDCTRERPRRKFFRRHPLSKEDMEKLRQALKTLSEAEKQLRTSNDKLTWLTAALLQLAPDQQYLLPSSSGDTSFNHSPLAFNNVGGRNVVRKASEQDHLLNSQRGLSTSARQAGTSGLHGNSLMKDATLDRKRHNGSSMAPQQTSTRSTDTIRESGRPVSGKSRKIEEIWLEVLHNIQYVGVKEFLYQEGKLMSVSFGAAPTVQLVFSSHLTKSTAEKFRGHILQAFESVLGSAVTIEIRCESKEDFKTGVRPLMLPASMDGSSQIRDMNGMSGEAQALPFKADKTGKTEIVETAASPRETKGDEHVNNHEESGRRGLKGAMGAEAATSQQKSGVDSVADRRKVGEKCQSQSIVRSKVSLAHVIQQAEGCSQRNGWSKRKAVSIAEKLEQENLRLEPRSRSLLCWKASKVTRRKLSRFKIRARRPRSLLKFVSCGKCPSTKSSS
ncbi:protein STICHEL-like 3 [Cannabis sativa]|uniref:protein STICHEL-like 3 n=1 Tax=Cannabis sativa TaxID=3483 RepID=UPI0011DF8A87|nr:protein STICHEL-like 3 [Cannabis sativa]XP_030479967.1 protein STICHEL-like 3 [Cannabis sativa]XP_060974775.1 protein STICHEL-like 3 [Cannabis sativa]XP_060974776.1 protein STICHEL-like 3 [Cannabis sativa]